MNIEQEIRDQIENIKKLKLSVGEINNHLSALEGMCRGDMQKQVDDAYQHGVEDGAKSVENWNNEEKKLRLDEAFDRGLTEAWELARALWHDKCGERSKLGCVSMQGVFANYTAQEAIAKLKSYEEKQKADDEIGVGDKVIWKTDGTTLIITSTYEAGGSNWCDGVAQDGKVYHTLAENNQKTGKHYNIASILEAMHNDLE